MRNKILIVTQSSEESEQLEQLLQEIVEAGGELFFTHSREEGLTILEKEKPQLVFLDAHLQGDTKSWHKSKTVIVVLAKPLIPQQVIERCRASLHAEPSAQIPPM